MATVSIKNIYLEMLRSIGGVDAIVEEAVKKYLIDKCIEKVEKAKNKIKEFEKIYNCNFSNFNSMITDENHLETIENEHPTWEGDYEEWEYWQKELNEWKAKLENILMKS